MPSRGSFVKEKLLKATGWLGLCVCLRTNVSLPCDSTTKPKPKDESEKRILEESVAEERDQVGHPVDSGHLTWMCLLAKAGLSKQIPCSRGARCLWDRAAAAVCSCASARQTGVL